MQSKLADWWRARLHTRRWLVRGVRGVTLGYLAAHFALTFLYVMPINPVSLELQGVLEGTIGRFFSQNWRLFAPNPLSSDQIVLARCLDDDEAKAALAGHLPTEGWFDLSTPVWERYHAHRFSAYDRVSRPATNAARQFISGGTHLAPWYESCQHGNQEACDVFNKQVELLRGPAALVLQRGGSSFCREAQAGRSTTHVAMRLRQDAATPWSKRNDASITPGRTDHELGIFPIVDWVEHSGLYTEAVR